MSTSATDGPAVPAGKKRSFLSRMRTVLKRGDGSNRLSFSKKSPIVTGTSAELTPVVAPIEEPKEQANIPEGPQPVKIMRSQIVSERARKLGERYNLKIEPLRIDPDREASRVEKPIRMRIHRACHRCNTTFAGNNICASCQHVKCKGCPRTSNNVRESEGKGKGKEIAAVTVRPGGVEAGTYYGQMVLTKPSPRPGGQPLVRKAPRQRVRRNCHECSAIFAPGSKICTDCQHVRCADCPRDPAKKKKYPNGYPGDVPSSDLSRPAMYSCHHCKQIFPSAMSPAAVASQEEGTQRMECARCSHTMCYECPRAPPQRIEPIPDSKILESIRVKLAAMDVKTGASNEEEVGHIV